MNTIRFADFITNSPTEQPDYIAGVKSDSTVKVDGALPYLVYAAQITQSGTSAPVATVLQNTIDAGLNWTYENVGLYAITLDESTVIFPSHKTFIAGSRVVKGTTDNVTYAFYGIDFKNEQVDIEFYVTDINNTLVNGVIGGTVDEKYYVEIRVYP